MKALWKRFVATFSRRSADDIDTELAFHLDMQTADNIAAGMTPGEARRAAILKLGGVEAARESWRDQRSLPMLESLFQDLRFALRSMGRNPGFLAITILSLGIGIGVNTAIFSIANAVLLKPLPFRSPDRLFSVREIIPQLSHLHPNLPANPVHAQEWGKQCASVESVSLVGLRSFHLTGEGSPELVEGAVISANLLETLGIQPQLGRAFNTTDEQQGARSVLITASLWRRKFASDPNIAGQIITIDGVPTPVTGVLPDNFPLPFSGGMEVAATHGRKAEVLQPLVLDDSQKRLMGNFNYGVVARIKDGVPPEQALAEINMVQAGFPRQVGAKVDLRAMLVPVDDLFTAKTRTGIWLLLAATGLVLLIVCVNVANLLLARTSARSREWAIRASLGAGRGRQIRQILTESFVLAAAGGLVGVTLAVFGLQFLLAWAPVELLRLDEVQIDLRVLAFALAITAATGLFAGLLPALRATGGELQPVLRSGGRSASDGAASLRLRQVLIGAEVALSAALLIGAALLGGSFLRLLHVDKGFDTASILTARVALPTYKYRDAGQRERFQSSLISRLSAMPGVVSAGLSSKLPGTGERWIDPISAERDPRPEIERPMVNHRWVSPGFFGSMGIRIIHGRVFTEADRTSEPAILSAAAAAKLWPGRDPIGLRFIAGDGRPRTLVGIAADVRTDLDKEPPMAAYLPYWQRPPADVFLSVRTTGDPRSVAGAIREAVRSQDRDAPPPGILTMDQVMGAASAQRRFWFTLVAAFAATALAVAALGIYGVIAYAVTRRRAEVGVRIALGAQRRDILMLIVGQGMRPVFFGLAAGIALALSLGRLIRSLLFQVEPDDPLVLIGVAAAIFCVAATAAVLPARRAASSEPAFSLRAD